MPFRTGRAQWTGILIMAAVPALAPPNAWAGTAVVRDILVEDFAPAYPDARRLALDKAMRDAVAAVLPRRAAAASRNPESLVSFIEVLDETIRPEYYAIRVSVGLTGPGIEQPAAEDGPPATVHAPGRPAVVPAAGALSTPRLGIKVPRGQPGALGAYRALLASLDVQHVLIHPNPDYLLDVTVSLRRRPAEVPTASPASGILVTTDPGPVE